MRRPAPPGWVFCVRHPHTRRPRPRRRAHPLRPRPPLSAPWPPSGPASLSPFCTGHEGSQSRAVAQTRCAPARRAGGSGSWRVEFVVPGESPHSGRRREGRGRSTLSAPGTSTHPQGPPRHGGPPPSPPPARGKPSCSRPGSLQCWLWDRCFHVSPVDVAWGSLQDGAQGPGSKTLAACHPPPFFSSPFQPE